MLRLLSEFLREAISTMKMVQALIWYLMVVPSGFGKTKQIGEVQVAKEIWFKTERDILPVTQDGLDKGVVKQRHRVMLNGVEISNQEVGLDGGTIEFTVGPAGISYTELLDWFDQAGNDSDDLAETTVVVDKVAPSAPGNFGASRQIAEVEVDVPDPPTDPTVDPNA